MSTDKVAVVTGSNQGIGYEIVKKLCRQFPGAVYLTSRDEAKGATAVDSLNKLGLHPEYHQLDVLDEASIARFTNHLKKKHGGVNVLVNNAAIAYLVITLQDSTVPFGIQAENCLATNYFGLVAVCQSLFPLLRPHARVVNLSSCEGHLSKIPGQAVRDRLRDPILSQKQLSILVHEFIKSAKEGTHMEAGWGHSPYRVSKIAVCALTFIQQRQFDEDPRRDIVVNAVHPGFVSSNLTRYRGPLTPDQGADAPTYLALLPPNTPQPRGQFVWKDRTVVSWVDPLKERC